MEESNIKNSSSQIKTNSSFRLRPAAPPWSPRRKRWPINQNNQSSSSSNQKDDSFLNASPEVVESEFHRMMKKFTHLDPGARRTARRRFAKMAAAHEEKRLAAAEELETSWRTSVKNRLSQSLKNRDLEIIIQALEEIDAALEARTLHETAPPTPEEDKIDSKVWDFLTADDQLRELVDESKKLLETIEKVPLEKYVINTLPNQPETTNSKHVLFRKLPKSLQVFDKEMKKSIETWQNTGIDNITITIPASKEFVEFIPKASRFGFQFQNANPENVTMQLTFS